VTKTQYCAAVLVSRGGWYQCTVSLLLLRLRNDLYCVEWGVKLYSLTPPPAPRTFSRILDHAQRAHALGDGRECPLISV